MVHTFLTAGKWYLVYEVVSTTLLMTAGFFGLNLSSLI
jgi:hypothetical protein